MQSTHHIPRLWRGYFWPNDEHPHYITYIRRPNEGHTELVVRFGIVTPNHCTYCVAMHNAAFLDRLEDPLFHIPRFVTMAAESGSDGDC